MPTTRSALIRHATTLPAGSPERKKILAGLRMGTDRGGWSYSDAEWLDLAMKSAKSVGATTVKEYLLKSKRSKGGDFFSDGSSGQYDAWHRALADVLRENGFPEEDTSGSFVRDHESEFVQAQDSLRDAHQVLAKLWSQARFEKAQYKKDKERGLSEFITVRRNLELALGAYNEWLEDTLQS